MPDLAMRIVAIYRRFLEEPDRFVRCDGNTRIEPGDEVFVLAASNHIAHVLTALPVMALGVLALLGPVLGGLAATHGGWRVTMAMLAENGFMR